MCLCGSKNNKMSKINPAFNKELEKFGSVNFNACYNCGNCTAVCSLSTEDNSFPREMVRLSALGLEDDIQASLNPGNVTTAANVPHTARRKPIPAN